MDKLLVKYHAEWIWVYQTASPQQPITLCTLKTIK